MVGRSFGNQDFVLLESCSSMVELRCYIPRVSGSIPLTTTRLSACSQVVRWRIATPLIGGSIPPRRSRLGSVMRKLRVECTKCGDKLLVQKVKFNTLELSPKLGMKSESQRYIMISCRTCKFELKFDLDVTEK